MKKETPYTTKVKKYYETADALAKEGCKIISDALRASGTGRLDDDTLRIELENGSHVKSVHQGWEHIVVKAETRDGDEEQWYLQNLPNEDIIALANCASRLEFDD